MKSLRPYIARNLAFFAALMVALLAFNAAAFGIFFSGAVAHEAGDASPAAMLHAIEDTTSASEASPEAKSKLRENGLWALFIKPDGDCSWSVDAPEGVPLHYTLQDVARFSKGYISDYPVFTRVTDAGLLVLGYPKDSYMKITGNYIPMRAVQALPSFLVVMAFLDVGCLFLAYWLSKRRTLSGLEPIEDAIEALGTGKAAHSLPKGTLANLSESVTRASDLIAKQNEARANWIAGISHDIRTPLTLIMGNAERIASDPSAPSDASGRAALISAQSAKISNLINDLNLVSQLEYDMQPLHKEKAKPSKIVRKAAADAINACPETGYSYEMEIEQEAEKAAVECDERLLGRAIGNILQNSVTHNPQGCRIRIGLNATDEHVLITIEDDGAGAAGEGLLALLKSQEPASSTDENLDLRHGLGLQIASRVIRAHQGNLSFAAPVEGGFKTVVQLSRC